MKCIKVLFTCEVVGGDSLWLDPCWRPPLHMVLTPLSHIHAIIPGLCKNIEDGRKEPLSLNIVHRIPQWMRVVACDANRPPSGQLRYVGYYPTVMLSLQILSFECGSGCLIFNSSLEI